MFDIRVTQNELANRMSPNALAIVFAPGLLRTKKPMSAQESLAQVILIIMSLLIGCCHSNVIFIMRIIPVSGG